MTPDRGPGAVSAARLYRPLAPFVALERRLGEAALARGPVAAGLYEFLRFGVKQGWACLFGGLLVALLLATHLAYPAGAPLTRYDALVLAALAIQAGLLATGMETWAEARIILVFHVVGTVMELFKTAAGSWVYPEASWLRIGAVPLFSGFLYAAVGSYMARVWRLFDFRFTRHPSLPATLALSAAIYLNFFTHHYGPDLRVLLFAWTAWLFRGTLVHFKVWRVHRRMPLLVGFGLVTLFIWLAENLGTFANAWRYPNQAAGWAMVPFAKFGSWFLLMIVSYVLVSTQHRIAPPPEAEEPLPAGVPQAAR